MSVLCVLADFFLKRASESTRPFQSLHFAAGIALYAASAFGWVYVLRHLKLAIVGAVYGVAVIVLLAGIGVIVFRESLSTSEIVGLGLAVASLILLGRFS